MQTCKFACSQSAAYLLQNYNFIVIQSKDFVLNFTQLSQVCSTRPEGAEALSPGQRPGYNGNQQGAL